MKHDKFIHRVMSFEPFLERTLMMGIMKSFPHQKELHKALEIIQQTGILQYYSESADIPFDFTTNPYKWSKYWFVRFIRHFLI